MFAPRLRVLVGIGAALPGVFGITGISELSAQPLGGLLLPRGSIALEVQGEFEQVSERLGGTGRENLGAPITTGLTTDRFQVLRGEQDALRVLLGDPSIQLNAGRAQAVTEVNAQRIPVRVGWGVLSRISLGASAPIVRRRADSFVLVTGEGANVGQNPLRGPDREGAQVFRTEAQAALAAAQAEVEARCATVGASAPSCIQGQQDVQRLQGFLSQLEQSWSSRNFFPLAGSPLGGLLESRWSDIRAGLTRLGVDGPAQVPLATSFDARALSQGLIDPLGNAEAFPRGVPESLYALGDAQLHLVLGLTGPDGLSNAFNLHSAVELTVRLATGTLDSMAVILPQEPLAGHGGLGARWVTDLALNHRVALGTELGWMSFQEGEGRLVALSPDFFWDGSGSGAQGTLNPGAALWARISPRFHLRPGLSLGLGYGWRNLGDGSWTAEDPDFPGGTLTGGSTHELNGELAFAGWHDPIVQHLPFPVELRIRGTRVMGGAEGMPVATRLQMEARVLRRR